MRCLVLAAACLIIPLAASGQGLDLNRQMQGWLCDRSSSSFNAEACEGMRRQPDRRNSDAPVVTDPAVRQRLERERQSMANRPPRVLGKPGDPSSVAMPSNGSEQETTARPGAMPSYAGKGCTYARARPGGASHGGATSACDPNARGRGAASYGPPPINR